MIDLVTLQSQWIINRTDKSRFKWYEVWSNIDYNNIIYSGETKFWSLHELGSILEGGNFFFAFPLSAWH